MAASTIVVALDPNRINLSAVSLAQMLSAEKKDSVSLESEYDTSFLNEYAQKMNGEAAAQNDDATQNEATTQNEAAAQNDDATQNEAAAQNQDASQPGVPVIPEITVEENFALTEKEYRLIKEYFDRRENFLDGGENVFENFGYYFSKKFSKPADYFTDYKLLQMLEKNFR
jgi:flagellar biosynthesis component FlhA